MAITRLGFVGVQAAYTTPFTAKEEAGAAAPGEGAWSGVSGIGTNVTALPVVTWRTGLP